MVMELWKSIDRMDTTDVRLMVQELKNKSSEISLEERFKLYFGLLKMDYLDNAMFQMQLIYNEIKDKGLNNEFVAAHPDLKINLMSTFNIWEDACGNIHVEEACDGSECCGPCCGCFGVLLCITMCCGPAPVEWMCSSIDPNTGWLCNFGDGGCCLNNYCCNYCCNICEEGCGCGFFGF